MGGVQIWAGADVRGGGIALSEGRFQRLGSGREAMGAGAFPPTAVGNNTAAAVGPECGRGGAGKFRPATYS